jgi:hypothetical protein
MAKESRRSAFKEALNKFILKRYDFSRADKVCKIDGALAPEVKQIESLRLVQSFLRSFKANAESEMLGNSVIGTCSTAIQFPIVVRPTRLPLGGRTGRSTCVGSGKSRY